MNRIAVILLCLLVSCTNCTNCTNNKPQLALDPCSGINPTASEPLQPASLQHRNGTCHIHASAQGYYLPDPTCTPGAINPTITQQAIKSCFRTTMDRNITTTEHEKFQTYKWYSTSHPQNNKGETQSCELDHLIPLELGGADTLDNIWPQCGPSGVTLDSRFFKKKDKVENYLARMVRQGKINLADAQKGIAIDWTQYLTEANR